MKAHITHKRISPFVLLAAILAVFMIFSAGISGLSMRVHAAQTTESTQGTMGWIQNSGSWYYYNESGNVATGWLRLGNTWYFMDESTGAMKTGWLQEGNHWYYLDSWGPMRTGWLNLNGTYYYFDRSGSMRIGWLQEGNHWYYLDSWGSMRTGWLNLNGTYYYFDRSGSMHTGWLQEGNHWYYLDSWGPMRTGWLNLNGTYYYFDRSGSMHTGWLTLDNSNYYLTSSGAMATGAVSIDGQIYHFNKNGEQSQGKLVVLDPGHSSVIPKGTVPVGPGSSTKKAADAIGTRGVSTRVYEYQLTLQIAFKLQKELESRGYTVLLTRTDSNTTHDCIERADVANNNNADCFIRLHANGSSNKSANGAMTICITKNNPYISSMYKRSRLLSDKVLDSYVAATGCKREYVWETDTMTGNNWSKVPTTLIEFGYMTNSAEDKKMQNANYQSKMVQGMANGIDAYFDAIE